MTVLRDEGANSGRSLVTDRRDFHKYAERAWCEVRTASSWRVDWRISATP